MTLTVAMTGAAGGIGSVLRAGLAREDFRVRAVDVVPVSALAPDDDVRQVDLQELAATQDALEGVDAVVHLAAKPAEATFEEIHRSNVVTLRTVPQHEAVLHRRRLGRARVPPPRRRRAIRPPVARRTPPTLQGMTFTDPMYIGD